MTDASYSLVVITRKPAIICRRCGAVSFHPRDISERYCGHCHVFHEDPAAPAQTDRGTMTDQSIAEALAAEVTEKTQPMELILSAAQVLAIAGVVQLALRHPQIHGEPKATSERFLAGAREYFADCPTVLEVLRRGDDPSQDVKLVKLH